MEIHCSDTVSNRSFKIKDKDCPRNTILQSLVTPNFFAIKPNHGDFAITINPDDSGGFATTPFVTLIDSYRVYDGELRIHN